MDEEDLNMLKKILIGLLCVVVFVGVYNLFDFVIFTYIVPKGYHFTVLNKVIIPMAFVAVIYTLLSFAGRTKDADTTKGDRDVYLGKVKKDTDIATAPAAINAEPSADAAADTAADTVAAEVVDDTVTVVDKTTSDK
ncbi:MAG: hypothetical protein IIZ45_04245 [Firmicutes bacterium]|nr:hypothetical protein [Bacillota bacterium]